MLTFGKFLASVTKHFHSVVTFLSRGEGVWKCQCLICYLNWEQSGHAPTSSLFLTVFFFFFFLMHHLCLFLRVSLLTNFPPAAVQWCQSYTLPALPRNSSLKWPKVYLERRKQKVSNQQERFGGGSFFRFSFKNIQELLYLFKQSCL